MDISNYVDNFYFDEKIASAFELGKRLVVQ